MKELHILYSLLNLLQGLLFVYLTFTSIYLFIFALASLFPYKRKKPLDFKKRRFAVLIPCYQEDEVIIEVSKHALRQNYPKSHYDVIVIADKFREKTIKKLKQLPLILYNQDFKISTKTRALNYALSNLPENKYDVACILDADNLMEPDFLVKLNDAFSGDFLAVQGHRVAKNQNTHFAVLDAVSEEINNNIFRKGQCLLGLSSALIGSAMAFKYNYFKNMMKSVEVVGGFDKEIELRLLSEGHAIEYLDYAYVYDEKVQNVAVFTRQRRRWLSAQFHYFGKHFIPATRALFKSGNIDYFNKAFQYLQLPRILLVGVLAIFTVFSWTVNPVNVSLAWTSSFLLALLSLLFATPLRFFNFKTLQALAVLPLGFLSMALSLLSIKGANKQFIHTKHTFNAFQKRQRHYAGKQKTKIR